MKKPLQILSLFLLALVQCLPRQFGGTTLQAQNLVPNGDFELGPDSSSIGWYWRLDSNCSALDTVLGPDFWIVVSDSPDRLIEGDIPYIYCVWDNGTAQSGKAYTVFIYDEAGKTTLLAPLQKDTIYRFQYYLSWETFQGLATQPSRIEFRFNNGGNTIASAHIATIQWNYFDTVFVASGNSTEMEIWGIEPVTGGVKVDNISLTKNFGTTINDIQNNNDRITLFPNPADDFIYVALKNKNISHLTLMNGVGENIKIEIVRLTHDCVRVDVSDLLKGFYIVSVQLENGKFITTKFLKF
ncbi:MAG: T9SS type A sorting domain-containing protein [Bacteroidia bacterium]|nr:T9SS type A sorting domain-containing protein [Bacteroidia bacterium]